MSKNAITFTLALALLALGSCSDSANTGLTPLGTSSLVASSANPITSSGQQLSSGLTGLSSVVAANSSQALSQGSSVAGSSQATTVSSSGRSSVAATSSVAAASSASIPSSTDKIANITKHCGNLLPATPSGIKSGWNSRYWDCCKPHCSYRENVDTNANPFAVGMNCSVSNTEIAAFKVSPNASPNASQYWFGYEGTKSGCDAGGEAYACFSQAPYAICDSLAYGYAAVPAADASFGKCFQIEFDGGNHDNNVKATHLLLKGKKMIVLASNIGTDVAAGQFDIMIPGGGVGIFAGGCATQWGVSASDAKMGASYGGFLTACQQTLGYNATAQAYKTCVKGMCTNLFGGNPNRKDLLDGCNWFADWMEAADNPTFKYAEVPCPPELTGGYRSTINTSKTIPWP